MFSSVRIRLMVWYAGVSGVILLLFSVGVYHVSKAALHNNVEAAVRSLGNAAEVALREASAPMVPLAARTRPSLKTAMACCGSRFSSVTVLSVSDDLTALRRVLLGSYRRASCWPALRAGSSRGRRFIPSRSCSAISASS